MAMATIENKECEEQFRLSFIVKIKKKSDRMLRNSHHSITTIYVRVSTSCVTCG